MAFIRTVSETEATGTLLAAAVRSFFSKVLDAVGAEPDPASGELASELRDVLSIGRPFPSS